jgi:membrane-associated PAP2 superfamily phosphatase
MYPISKSQLIEMILWSIVVTFLMILFHQTVLDSQLASYFFSPSGLWVYRDNYILEKILHKGGVLLVIGVLVFLIAWIVKVYKKEHDKKLRDYLSFIVASSIITIFIVFLLKRSTTLPCPWDSVEFGGHLSIPPLWYLFSGTLPSAHCFPGGHSSGAYAFLSVYFGYTFIYGKRKIYALLPGLGAGIVFGMVQQIRGAHFMSHDFATILISILSSLITMLVYSNYNKKYEI